MATEEIVQLTVAVAELKTKVEGLVIADERMRANMKGVYTKLDRLTYAFIALLSGVIVDIISHNLN